MAEHTAPEGKTKKCHRVFLKNSQLQTVYGVTGADEGTVLQRP
jgi:hypothetical protein